LIADAAGFMMEVSDVANPAEPGLRIVVEVQVWEVKRFEYQSESSVRSRGYVRWT
jgi:hypothetical protein